MQIDTETMDLILTLFIGLLPIPVSFFLVRNFRYTKEEALRSKARKIT